MTTLLAIDIGNTNVSLGLFDYSASGSAALSEHWRIGTHREQTSDETALTVRALARAEGVDEALLEEWKTSMPHLAGFTEGAARSTARKAWRFVMRWCARVPIFTKPSAVLRGWGRVRDPSDTATR